MIVGANMGNAGDWIVHTRPVHAVMAVHTVYQSNAYRIDFNICVRRSERRMGRRGREKNAEGGRDQRKVSRIVKAPVADALFVHVKSTLKTAGTRFIS